MVERLERSLSAPIIPNYSISRHHEAKEEALALISFQRTKLERTIKKYKIGYYFLISFCTVLFLYNLAFTIIWGRIHAIFFSKENAVRCQNAEFVICAFILIHALGLPNLVLAPCAAKRQRRKLFLFCQVLVVTLLVGRIILFSQYFELEESAQGCPLEEYPISAHVTMKVLLAVECAGDAVILIISSHLIWLLHKIKGKQKMFTLLNKSHGPGEL